MGPRRSDYTHLNLYENNMLQTAWVRQISGSRFPVVYPCELKPFVANLIGTRLHASHWCYAMLPRVQQVSSVVNFTRQPVYIVERDPTVALLETIPTGPIPEKCSISVYTETCPTVTARGEGGWNGRLQSRRA